MSSRSRDKLIEEITSEVLSCTQCRLWKQRRHAVPGKGDSQARAMFVGEAPGRNEDLAGVPFVGAAGRILDELLRRVEIPREEVYITNIVKCRPPRNRNPRSDEISTCTGLYLSRQIHALRPRVLILLGRHAATHIFETVGIQAGSITKIHGTVHEISPYGFSLIAIPMLHPAAALRSARYRALLERDFQKSMCLLHAT